MKEDNVVQRKSFDFAVRAVNAYKYICESKREFVLSKQFLRSATSIGANIEEAIGAQSDADFKAKLGIAYKEARETKYWINLMNKTDFFTDSEAESLLNDIEELLKIIGSIQVSLKKRNS